ncbi:MAG: DUF3788 domain-containing protein [Defluviitaleaceae bacterium]|nr:DUF3788 domain-containing protein [Defluviitaleaceae bacterium]
MQWFEVFDKENKPTEEQIKEFVNMKLWLDLESFLQQECKIKSKIAHSGCAMDGGLWKGWNVKYAKSGKALCTLYPKQGYFLLLMPIGASDMSEAEMIIATCSEYTQNLFNKTKAGKTGKSLAFDVKSEEVLDDIKKLLLIRAKI